MISRKYERNLTVAAIVAAVSLIAAGLAKATWWSDWVQGLGSNQDSGGNSQAVAAVRGGWDSNAAAKDSDRRNFAAIDRLDKLEFSSDDVDKFVREGHLAP